MNIRRITALIARAHSDLTIAEFTVTWVTRPRRLEYRDGGTYQTAKVLVQAPGYTTRTMIVTEDEDSFSIR